MPSLTRYLLAGASLLGSTLAVTSYPDSTISNWLNAGGVDLAVAAAPMWFFGQALNQPPCYPTNATTGSGGQTPSAALCDWPNAGCNCRTPGVGIGNQGPAFPVYYTYSKCTSTEIRIAYNLFYEKDGFNPSGLFGHRYDWERAIVIWGQNGDGSWRPTKLMISQHSGYQTLAWGSIQNTLNSGDETQNIGGPNGRQNLDHAKVYVAWSKHANYDKRNTGWNDVLSQLTDNAFRSQDWWYLPKSNDYLRADRSTALGQLIASFDYGDATSNPPSVHDGLCSAS